MKQTVFIILLTFTVAYCECKNYKTLSIKNESLKSSKIFVGKLVSIQKNNYEFEVIKLWKGTINDNGKIIIVQSHKEQYTDSLFLQRTYLIYCDSLGIHNFNRTTFYEFSLDPDFLDIMFNNTIFNQIQFDSIEKTRCIVNIAGAGNVDLKGKKILIYDHGHFTTFDQYPPDRTYTRPGYIYFVWPCYYLVKRDLTKDNLDFLIEIKYQSVVPKSINESRRSKIIFLYNLYKTCH